MRVSSRNTCGSLVPWQQRPIGGDALPMKQPVDREAGFDSNGMTNPRYKFAPTYTAMLRAITSRTLASIMPSLRRKRSSEAVRI